MCPEITKSEVAEVPVTAVAEPKAPAKVMAKKPAKKAVKVPAKPKKEAKKIAPKVKKEKKDEKVDRSMADMPVSERRKKLLSCLKKKGATNAGTAIPGTALAKALGFTNYDVYMLGYRTSPLIIDGLVKAVKMEDVHGLSYYLTAKGLKA